MNVYENEQSIERDDIIVRIVKIQQTSMPLRCKIHGCDSKEIYDVQIEKPKDYSNLGGWFCARHIKSIFAIDV